MQASLIPTEHIPDVWSKIEEYMQGAADYTYGRFTKEDILAGTLTKPQQLWIAFDEQDNNAIYGAVVTEIIDYPRMRALVMHFTGGKDLPKWKTEMLSLLRRFSKDQGCSIIESYGRPGWEKVFKDDGYRKPFTFYELPVEN